MGKPRKNQPGYRPTKETADRRLAWKPTGETAVAPEKKRDMSNSLQQMITKNQEDNLEPENFSHPNNFPPKMKREAEMLGVNLSAYENSGADLDDVEWSTNNWSLSRDHMKIEAADVVVTRDGKPVRKFCVSADPIPRSHPRGLCRVGCETKVKPWM